MVTHRPTVLTAALVPTLYLARRLVLHARLASISHLKASRYVSTAMLGHTSPSLALTHLIIAPHVALDHSSIRLEATPR